MIFLTSDQHFGHNNIIRYSGRPFADVREMEEALVERYNAVVGDNDEVYHLGDFSLTELFVGKLLKRLRGRKHLVPGNHDGCHPKHRRAEAAKRRYLMWGFDSVAVERHLEGFLLSHMPYTGDHSPEDRYAQWRPKDSGQWLLHGHVHEAWKVRGRMINVGVDVWNYTPVPLEVVKALR